MGETCSPDLQLKGLALKFVTKNKFTGYFSRLFLYPAGIDRYADKLSNRREIPVGKIKFMNTLVTSLIFFREAVHILEEGLECNHPLQLPVWIQWPWPVMVASGSRSTLSHAAAEPTAKAAAELWCSGPHNSPQSPIANECCTEKSRIEIGGTSSPLPPAPLSAEFSRRWS